MLLECQTGKGTRGTGWFISGQFYIGSEEILYWLGRSLVDLYARTMLKMDVVRHAPLPGGPKILAANHPTTIDPFLMLTLTSQQMSILVTGDCFKVPVFGRYLRAAGHVPVLQDNGRAAFEEARQLLQAGHTIGIFPEGALSPLEEGLGLHEARTGTARLSLSTGAPVIPVGIHLQRERIRFVGTEFDGRIEVARWYPPGPYAVTVGQPLYFEGDVEDREHVHSVSKHIMQHIDHLAHQSAQRMRTSQALKTGTASIPARLANAS